MPSSDSYFSHVFSLFYNFGIEIPRDIFTYYTDTVPPLDRGTPEKFRKNYLKYQRITRYSYDFIITVCLCLKRLYVESCTVYILQALEHITYFNSKTKKIEGVGIMDDKNSC